MTTRDPRPDNPVRGSATGRPIMALFDLVGRRWILRIIWELNLAQRALTFRDLRTRCSDMSASVLTRRIAELRRAQLVERLEGGYVLTELGLSLIDNMRPLLDWSIAWAESLDADLHDNGG